MVIRLCGISMPRTPLEVRVHPPELRSPELDHV